MDSSWFWPAVAAVAVFVAFNLGRWVEGKAADARDRGRWEVERRMKEAERRAQYERFESETADYFELPVWARLGGSPPPSATTRFHGEAFRRAQDEAQRPTLPCAGCGKAAPSLLCRACRKRRHAEESRREE